VVVSGDAAVKSAMDAVTTASAAVRNVIKKPP
jgi:hypothetical protein